MWELWKIIPESCYDADFGEVYDEHILVCAGSFEDCLMEWENEGLDPFYTYMVNTECGGVLCFDHIPS